MKNLKKGNFKINSKPRRHPQGKNGAKNFRKNNGKRFNGFQEQSAVKSTRLYLKPSGVKWFQEVESSEDATNVATDKKTDSKELAAISIVKKKAENLLQNETYNYQQSMPNVLH